MEYIYTILNGGNSYSVFTKQKVSEGKIINTYGICIENISDTVYVPDITTVKDIALCMIKVISTDCVMPERLHNVIYDLIS